MIQSPVSSDRNGSGRDGERRRDLAGDLLDRRDGADKPPHGGDHAGVVSGGRVKRAASLIVMERGAEAVIAVASGGADLDTTGKVPGARRAPCPDYGVAEAVAVSMGMAGAAGWREEGRSGPAFCRAALRDRLLRPWANERGPALRVDGSGEWREGSSVVEVPLDRPDASPAPEVRRVVAPLFARLVGGYEARTDVVEGRRAAFWTVRCDQVGRRAFAEESWRDRIPRDDCGTDIGVDGSGRSTSRHARRETLRDRGSVQPSHGLRNPDPAD